LNQIGELLPGMCQRLLYRGTWKQQTTFLCSMPPPGKQAPRSWLPTDC